MPDTLNVLQFGADSSGNAPCTAALQRALDACADHGGGRLFFPPGTYVSGTLWMRSNITIELHAGAILAAQPDVRAFPVYNSAWEGSASPGHAPLIAGEGLRNVALTGRGTIDGRGGYWWDLFERQKLSHTRPHLFRLVDCRDVTIEGLNFIRSPRWTINPVACENVRIASVHVRNPADSPNTDGINPDSCNNVRISNCRIDVGDDCIAIKSGSTEDKRPNPRPCQNVVVTDCTMLHGHGGVVIGSETSGGIRDVRISNCVFSGTDRGIRLKSRRGRGGVVENISADNIVMDDVLCPIVVNLFYACGASADDAVFSAAPRPVDRLTPRIHRLRFSDITVRRAKFAAAYIRGLPEMFVEDLELDRVSIYMDASNTSTGAPAMAIGCEEMCRAGFFIENAANVKLRQVDLVDQLGPALLINNSPNVLIGDLLTSDDEKAQSSVAARDGSKIERIVKRLSDSIAVTHRRPPAVSSEISP